MAAGKFYAFAFLTALVAVNLIFAQDVERETRSADEESEEPQDRFFLSLFFPLTTTCNYTTQSGSTCLSCSQALNCLPNNVGYLRNCRGFLPYCNAGRCTFIPGPLCFNATG